MEKLKSLLKTCERIAFFGGAGVSTESGIPDFKSPQGIYTQERKDLPGVVPGKSFRTETYILADGKSCRRLVYNEPWAGYAPEEILHTSFFYGHTDLFYKFYFSKMVHPSARPNAAHMALASLERAGRLLGVVTQNIDGLHSMAGSVRVAELHGSVYRNRCIVCNTAYPLSKMLEANPEIPKCQDCGGIIKPDVVLYSEQLPELAVNDAVRIISGADCLIVGGTSLTVYPAASFLEYFRGKNLVLINRDETPYDNRANVIIRGPIGQVLGEAVM